METLDSNGAAELLHVSVKTACELARRGEVPAVQLGSGWVYLKDDLIDWLREKARQEQQERREAAMIAASVPKPVRGRGRPRKTFIGG